TRPAACKWNGTGFSPSWALFGDIFFSSRRRHTRFKSDWSSDVCSSDLPATGSRRPPGSGRGGCRAFRLERLPPGAVAGVPARRLLQSLAERGPRRVPHGPEPAVVEGVAPV